MDYISEEELSKQMAQSRELPVKFPMIYKIIIINLIVAGGFGIYNLF